MLGKIAEIETRNLHKLDSSNLTVPIPEVPIAFDSQLLRECRAKKLDA